MERVRLLLLVLLALACSAPPAAAPPPPREPKDCVKECERRNMMRAISPEMIRQDCERECSASKN
jgi:hypothetical protein